MPSRQRTIMTVSLPPAMAQEYRQLARRRKESNSGLFREMFTFYRQEKLQAELRELQGYGAAKAREQGLTEEDIERLVFGDR